MNDTIDGMPVTRRSVRFEAAFEPEGDWGMLRAGQVIPMVVLVGVGPVEHVPGGDDDYHRVDVLRVSRLAGPRSAEENDYLLGILRGEATNEAPDVKSDAGNIEAADGPPSRWVTRADGGLMPNDRPAIPASEQSADDAVADEEYEEDDFVLPPPPPVPEGKETRRQIVPGDPQLRNFLGE